MLLLEDFTKVANKEEMISKCGMYLLYTDAQGYIYPLHWFYGHGGDEDFYCFHGHSGYEYSFTYQDALDKLNKYLEEK